jgi:hypothetical protein
LSAVILPRRLADPVVVRNGNRIRDVLLDFTAYVDSFSTQDLDALVRWYAGFAPPGSCRFYMIEDNSIWDSVSRPLLLTRLGRAAARAGDPLPFLAPTRARILERRRFWMQFWDGAKAGSWSICMRAMHRLDSGWHPFVRLMIPVTADPTLLLRAAVEWSDFLDIRSGHGGFAFTYDPWHLDRAFDNIYALAKRFWGVEVEHLNGTLPLMVDRIKSVSWLTVVGGHLRDRVDIAANLELLASRLDLSLEVRSRATVIRIGDAPAVGDQNRPDTSLDGYYAVARALEPLFVDDHADFPGMFSANGDTVGWIRRFVDPRGWR